MASRRLDADEAQAWARVMASVRPLRVVEKRTIENVSSALPPVGGAGSALDARSHRRVAGERAPTPKPPPASGRGSAANTLDGSWDRRLGRGLAQPDSSLDLHGHTLASAHALLDQGLARAIGAGDRLLLLVTGKPPRPDSERPHARGAIRSAVADWLAASRHADRIAAVRGAHPRHGGAGALYIVLRKPSPRRGEGQTPKASG